VIAGSRDALGDAAWLDYYLTSPIWRFALRPGVIDEHAWAGVLVPSVDSVGRYFPLTLTVPVSPQQDLFALMAEQGEWYAGLEQTALAALQQQLDADTILAQLGQLGMPALSSAIMVSPRGTLMISGNRNSLFSSVLPQLTDQQAPYSLWAAAETENSPTLSMMATGLPSPNEYSAMLTGDWAIATSF